MTVDHDFEELAASYESIGWYAAWMEARQGLYHALGTKGFNVANIGWLAWDELNPEQRRDALSMMFTDYYISVANEERELQHQSDIRDGSSYLEGFEAQLLNGALDGLDLSDEDAEVTVNARCLSNVLFELDLLQYRVAMREKSGEVTS